MGAGNTVGSCTPTSYGCSHVGPHDSPKGSGSPQGGHTCGWVPSRQEGSPSDSIAGQKTNVDGVLAGQRQGFASQNAVQLAKSNSRACISCLALGLAQPRRIISCLSAQAVACKVVIYSAVLARQSQGLASKVVVQLHKSNSRTCTLHGLILWHRQLHARWSVD